MVGAEVINVQQFVNERRISRHQWVIFATCYLIAGIDVYDLVAVSFVAPIVGVQWNLASSALGPALSASIVGAAIGALGAGLLTERTSPKFMLITGVFLLGVMTLASASATSAISLAIYRFLTGVGIGATAPITTMLVYEYAPARRSSLLVNMMYVGPALGSMLCGIVAASGIPVFGWQVVFLVGGAVAVLLAFAAIVVLPEPLRYLTLNQALTVSRIRRILKRIDRSIIVGDDVRFVTDEISSPAKRSGMAMLLSKHYRTVSMMLWFACFCAMFVYYLLTSWMPTLIRSSGATFAQASLLSPLPIIGGLVGAIGVGALMDRFDKKLVVAGSYGLGGISIWTIGQLVHSVPLLAASLFAMGVSLQGALMSTVTLASVSYPTSARPAGLSALLAIGRMGGILGPVIGGYLLLAELNITHIFSLLAIPCVAAMVGLLVGRWTAPPAEGARWAH
jgi:AAHS family 4-hydroxybenzoate transporter-like MFS transporter